MAANDEKMSFSCPQKAGERNCVFYQSIYRKLEQENWLSELEIFKLTEQSIESLAKEPIPKEVIEKLKNFKDKEISGKKSFLDMIAEHIGEANALKYSNTILRYSKASINKIIGNLRNRAKNKNLRPQSWYVNVFRKGKLPKEYAVQ